MSAYIFVDLEVTDPEKFAKYRELVEPLIEAHGGKYIVRGGKHEVLEGEWTPNRVVILEFDSIPAAKKFWDSDDYEPVKQIRQATANSNIIMVDGV